MNKNKEKIFIICFSVTLLAGIAYSVFASIALPNNVINEQTKECAVFIAGDECVRCGLPQGWQNIGQNPCPQGYKETEVVPVCVPQKTFFCCTQLHSGLPGDCQDLVVNDVGKKCAFVENVDKCQNFPKGWKSAEQIPGWGRLCPSDYQWREEYLECEQVSGDNQQNNKPPQIDNNNNQNEEPPINDVAPRKTFLSPAIIAITVLLLIFVLYLILRVKKKKT